MERAHILFVTPDKDGEVHDKVYEFDDTDERELKKLLVAVYSQVETLAFLDDPEVMRAADAGLGLKDIKTFIELLLAKDAEK